MTPRSDPPPGPSVRVLAETAYPPRTASPRVRIAEFGPFLHEHGIDLRYHPTLTDRQYEILSSRASLPRKAGTIARSASRALLRTSPDHNLLLVHRLRLINRLPRFDPPSRLDIYDFDDALYLSSMAPVNGRFRWVKDEARRWVEYVRRSRVTIAGNSFLADRAREHARHVEVIPSCVDPDRQTLHAHRETEVSTIGWIGSATTSPYLAPVLPAIERLNARQLRAKLVLVGAEPSLKAPWIEHRPWSLRTEGRELAGFDIGIAPLPDSEWAHGKCGYKLLRYFAAGVPAVASPVGLASELIGGQRGLVADSTADWHRALDELLRDHEARGERGTAARQYVERHYSYRRWAPEFAALLRSLAG